MVRSTVLLAPVPNGRSEQTAVVAPCCFVAAYATANVVLCMVNMERPWASTGGVDFPVLWSFGMICSFVGASAAPAAGAAGSMVWVVAGVGLGAWRRRRFRLRPQCTRVPAGGGADGRLIICRHRCVGRSGRPGIVEAACSVTRVVRRRGTSARSWPASRPPT